MSYTIQSGDTFWSISQKIGFSVEALEAANPGISPSNLQVGQTIRLPGSGLTQHTIVQGDTLWVIAQKSGVTLDALLAANPGINPSNLQVGQIVNVPRPPTTPAGNGGGSAPHEPSPGGDYVMYSGPASAFPDPRKWASYGTLWAQNRRLMKLHDSDQEIGLIKSSVDTVSKESGVDPRVILCIIVQESGGNPRVPTTNNGVRNPGLMQSHNGVEFNPADPAGSILQMIRDGTEGTRYGDGLKQCYTKYGNWYSAFRAYNSGSVDASNLNNPVGATAAYVRDAANRLMGHTWPGM